MVFLALRSRSRSANMTSIRALISAVLIAPLRGAECVAVIGDVEDCGIWKPMVNVPVLVADVAIVAGVVDYRPAPVSRSSSSVPR